MNLTEEIRLHVIDGIMTGRYAIGGRLPAERECAEMTGYSRITVRRAYEQLEQAGIIVRRRPGGTFVASKFRARSGEMTSVGVISTLPSEFASRFIAVISRCCQEADALPVLGIPEPDTAETQLKLATRMVTRGVRDLIIWGADHNIDVAAFERLRILGVNMVFFDRMIPGKYADYVGLDNYAGIAELLNCARRHQTSGYYFITTENRNVDTEVEREDAFLKWTAGSKLPAQVFRIDPYASREDRARLLRQLSALPENSAVIGVNAGILQQLFTTAPERLHLYCIDHVTRLQENLNITGYSQPISAMAAKAFELLQEQHRKGERWRAAQYRFPGTLVEI